MDPIRSIAAYQQAAGVASATSATTVARPAETGGVDFGDAMTRAIGAVEAQHASADSALQRLASGEQIDIHGTMIELEKADIALRTMVSVRDRFISAYEQVMNMSV